MTMEPTQPVGQHCHGQLPPVLALQGRHDPGTERFVLNDTSGALPPCAQDATGARGAAGEVEPASRCSDGPLLRQTEGGDGGDVTYPSIPPRACLRHDMRRIRGPDDDRLTGPTPGSSNKSGGTR
jgi:hypothetical protein